MVLGDLVVPKEAIDFISDSISELRQDIRNLHIQMHNEHTELGKRVTSLEYQGKITKWIFGAGGALLTLVLREIVPKLF